MPVLPLGKNSLQLGGGQDSHFINVCKAFGKPRTDGRHKAQSINRAEKLHLVQRHKRALKCQQGWDVGKGRAPDQANCTRSCSAHRGQSPAGSSVRKVVNPWDLQSCRSGDRTSSVHLASELNRGPHVCYKLVSESRDPVQSLGSSGGSEGGSVPPRSRCNPAPAAPGRLTAGMCSESRCLLLLQSSGTLVFTCSGIAMYFGFLLADAQEI